MDCRRVTEVRLPVCRQQAYHRRRGAFHRSAQGRAGRPRRDSIMTIGLAHLQLRHRPPTPARALPEPLTDFFRGRLAAAQPLLDAPFKGITTDGTVVPGLYSIRGTGVSTEP